MLVRESEKVAALKLESMAMDSERNVSTISKVSSHCIWYIRSVFSRDSRREACS